LFRFNKKRPQGRFLFVSIFYPGKSSQPRMNADIQCAACIRQPSKKGE